MTDFKDFDFSLFSDRQLHHLARQVIQEIARRREQEVKLRVQGGLREGEGPRYCNPTNPSETWSGKGRVPSWVAEALESGLRLEDLELADNRPVPGRRRRGKRGR